MSKITFQLSCDMYGVYVLHTWRLWRVILLFIINCSLLFYRYIENRSEGTLSAISDAQTSTQVSIPQNVMSTPLPGHKLSNLRIETEISSVTEASESGRETGLELAVYVLNFSYILFYFFHIFYITDIR